MAQIYGILVLGKMRTKKELYSKNKTSTLMFHRAGNEDFTNRLGTEKQWSDQWPARSFALSRTQ
jgi:hypothetical protein